MKAKKKQIITSINLPPTETWIVMFVDRQQVIVRAKSDRLFQLGVYHGQYNIVG